MDIAAVTNEVVPGTQPGTLRRVFETAVGQGITTFEARTIEGRRFPLVAPDVWDQLVQARKEFGIVYSAISPGIFIRATADSDLIAIHAAELVDMSLRMGEKLGVDTLIVFAPDRAPAHSDTDFSKVVDLLGAVTERAAAHGYQVQLENLPGSYADTSDACLALLDAVGHKHLGYVWDTGNLYEAEGATFEAGLAKLAPYIRNVHLKDGRLIDGKMTWQHFGTGVTNVKGQVEALKAMGYSGTLVLEAACDPHAPDDFATSLTYLKALCA
ncbi:MAG: sugar phosphate isomerase/epimerase family protein [Paracoccus sp. (in: a-proteobacteria)]|uniref:sugar phosphate isomerase/epimerase family protein n=1 Tax=Paracoccus sp. TaxID=267 RepID=UPI00391C7983